jgi:hypothetical protein
MKKVVLDCVSYDHPAPKMKAFPLPYGLLLFGHRHTSQPTRQRPTAVCRTSPRPKKIGSCWLAELKQQAKGARAAPHVSFEAGAGGSATRSREPKHASNINRERANCGVD